MNSADVLWVLVSSVLVFITAPGLASFYGGPAKRKNMVNTIMSSAVLMGIAALSWLVVGFSLPFSGSGSIIGDANWFLLNFFLSDSILTPNTMASVLFQMMFAILTPVLITGVIVERVKLFSLVVFVTPWPLLVYYPMAHMVWGGGFLSDTGSIDFTDGNVVHISSGISTLVLAMVLGKQNHYGKATYYPHNVPFVLLGAALLWFGWSGFNGGSVLVTNELATRAMITTDLAATCSMLSWLLIDKLKNGKPTLVGVPTGVVIGLTAITPGAGFVPIWAPVIVGPLASPISYFFITVVRAKFGYDDALDVFGCHGVGDIRGDIATGLFTLKSISPVTAWSGFLFSDANLFLRQLGAIGVMICVVIVGTPTAVGIAFVLTKGIRVPKKGEDMGLDHREHGEVAYPTFSGMD